jgi:hypothetical protein
VFIKILYVVLVLCVGAVVGAVIAGYVRIRHHMSDHQTHRHEGPKPVEVEQEIK